MAADFAGIGEATLQTWLASKLPKFREFQEAVKAATSRGDVGSLAVIQQAAKAGQWQAAAWLLERRHPAEYGRRQVVAVARAPEVDTDALSRAAAQGIGTADAAVLFRRQLDVIEAERIAGRITVREYLAAMANLTAQATRLAELAARVTPTGQNAPHVQLSLTLDSAGIDAPAPLPADVELPKRAASGGDLIEVG
jgi:hypothetical protein